MIEPTKFWVTSPKEMLMISRWALVVRSSKTCILVVVVLRVKQGCTLMMSMRTLTRVIEEPSPFQVEINGGRQVIKQVHRSSGKMLIRKRAKGRKILRGRCGMNLMTSSTSMTRGPHMRLRMKLRGLTIRPIWRLSLWTPSKGSKQ